MALCTNGTIGNYLKRTGNMPAWGSSALIGFFMEPSDTNQAQTLIQFGGSGGFTALQLSADGTSLTWYHDWGSWSGAFTTITIGRWYAFYVGANGTAGKAMVKDLTTGTVYTVSGTNPGGWAANVDEVWLGSFTYGARSATAFAGFRLFGASLTDEEIENEWQSFAPRRQSNLLGYWPMIHTAKADCLKDVCGLGDFVETGSAITVLSSQPPVGWGAAPLIVPYGAALPAILEQYRYRWFNDNGIEAAA